MRRLLLTLWLVAAQALALEAAAREPISRDLPLLMMADEISYDRELGTVVARGNVEITQGERTLTADTVSYNQKTDTVSASGNVALLEPSGEVVFAEYVELRDQLKNGVIERIRVLLNDDSRFAANSAERRDGNRTLMRRAVYSPCKICEKNPDAPPLWQLKAERVEHDQAAQEVRYRDAFLEMWGMPVAYTPYLSHPDPTVDRKTGFLAPDFGTGGNVGAHIRAPYFITLGDDKDFTLDPIVTEEEGLVLSGEYRQRFDKGRVRLSGSVAEAQRLEGDPNNPTVQGDRLRGHVSADGQYHFDETWRAGFILDRASDRSYLRKFDFFDLNRNTLRSNAVVEGFRRRNYMAANAYWFQDLRTDERQDQPVVAPVFDFNHLGEADNLGGRWSLDTNLRFLYRTEATDSHRLSFKPGYQVTNTWEPGFVTTFTTNVQADVYRLDQNGAPVAGTSNETFAGRFMPRAALDVRYPFARQIGSVSHIVEPIFLGTIAPNGGNPGEIPDEESTTFELDDTNLLSLDRFAGLDRVEGGPRIVYGLKTGLYGPRIGAISAFLGQSFRFHHDRTLNETKLLEKDFSDYVGRIDVRPNEYLDILYRFRFAKADLDAQSSAVSFGVGPAAFKVIGEYFFVGQSIAATNSDQREELTIGVSSRINRYWSTAARTRRDLTEDGGSLAHALTISYEDECFAFHTIAERTFTRDADIEPESRFLFRFIFKHLGEVTSRAG